MVGGTAVEIESKGGSSECVLADCVYMFFFGSMDSQHAYISLSLGCCWKYWLCAYLNNINVTINIQMENTQKNLLCDDKIEQSRKKYGNFGICIVDEKQQTPKMLNRYITIAIFTSRSIKMGASKRKPKWHQNQRKETSLAQSFSKLYCYFLSVLDFFFLARFRCIYFKEKTINLETMIWFLSKLNSDSCGQFSPKIGFIPLSCTSTSASPAFLRENHL